MTNDNTSVVWATDTFKALNLAWTVLSAPRDHKTWHRIQGLTHDRAGGVELWIDPAKQQLHRATVITPINAAYTPLIVFVIAAIANTERSVADVWLAKILQDLKTARKKEVTRSLQRVKAVARITTVGVFSLVMVYQ